MGLGLSACKTPSTTVPAPAELPAPAPPVNAPSPRLQEQLVQALRSRLEQPAAAQPASALAAAVADFYRLREDRPAWSEPIRAQALLTALRSTADDGLNPEDYALAMLSGQVEAGVLRSGDPATLADFDLQATRACLLALAQLYRGKVDPHALDPQWSFASRELDRSKAMGVISEAIDGGRIAELFEQARPVHPIYARLRAALVHYRQLQAAGGWPTLPDGPSLKPGMRDARVPLLRQRFEKAGETLAPSDDPEFYDADLQAAVQRFQKAQYLEDDGAIGKQTRLALNVSVDQRVDQLRVNLERARWLLHQLHGEFILVDIAGYRIAYFRDDKPVWRSRVQVGRAYRRTPLFRSDIAEVEFNPTWTVPPTIFKEDVLSKLRHDLGYLKKNQIRVLDTRGRELDAAEINWGHPPYVLLRQDAGPKNSLGRVALRFPNPYSVYLHDTPHQELFDEPRRNFSSGCIRVERAMELVRLLLDDPERWTDEAIDAMLATLKTQTVRLPHAVPLIVQYWTVDVPADGSVGFKPDVYERDAPLLEALNRPLSEGEEPKPQAVSPEAPKAN